MNPAESQKVFEYEWMFIPSPSFMMNLLGPLLRSPLFTLFFCEELALLTTVKKYSGHNNFLLCGKIIQFENDLAIQLIFLPGKRVGSDFPGWKTEDSVPTPTADVKSFGLYYTQCGNLPQGVTDNSHSVLKAGDIYRLQLVAWLSVHPHKHSPISAHNRSSNINWFACCPVVMV